MFGLRRPASGGTNGAMKTSRYAFGAAALAAVVAGCTPGYIKPSDLESRNQGPSSCAKACQDIGMRMTAMVLVGDAVPGCVCQPVEPAPPGSPPPPPASSAGPERGAAAAAGGYVLIAAAAARQQQEHQRHQSQGQGR
jgi:hypothetical protein